MGEPFKIVGIKITLSKGRISITQAQNIKKILTRQGLDDASPVQMPLDPNVKIIQNPNGNSGNRSNSFAQLLGKLQYIAISTRSDIGYAVNQLASYAANPSMQHVMAAKRILRYLSGTHSYGITYKASPDGEVIFKGLCDTLYADQEDCKLTYSYVFMSADRVITWKSGKEGTVAQFTTEAEYIALWEAGKEVLWLRNLHHKLGLTQKEATTIGCNNKGAIEITKNLVYHLRTKHIDTHYHWVRDKVEEGRFFPEFCMTAKQTANVLTKALPWLKHQQHAQEMELCQSEGEC